MISIRKTVSDLERIEELEKREQLSSTILDCYSMAIHSAGHYAVEVDTALAAEFRKNLKLIEDQTRSATTPEQLRSAQSSFRGELREYRDKSNERLNRMRKEMKNATAAMAAFAETVASNGISHEREVDNELRGLESTAQSSSLEEIRRGIGMAVCQIETSVQQIQRGNQLVVAQLQDEIRLLHEKIDEERKALETDRASGAWNREKIDAHIDNLLRQNRPFCLLLVWINNFKRIESQHSRTVVEGTLKALTERFIALAGGDAVIGRWAKDQFVAVLDLTPGHAIALSTEATRKLSGNYAVQENGLAQKVTLQATSGIIDRQGNVDSATFHQKLQQLAGAICGA